MSGTGPVAAVLSLNLRTVREGHVRNAYRTRPFELSLGCVRMHRA